MRRFLVPLLCLLAPAVPAQTVPTMETQADAVMIAEALFYENLVPVNYAVGSPPNLTLFRFEVFDVDLYSDDGMWRWTEDFSQGVIAGDKTYSGLIEFGFYAIDPSRLTIPVEIAFIGGAVSEDADIWQIGVICADGTECVEGRVRSEEDQQGYLDELLAEFAAEPATEVDLRTANYWWIEGEVEARRVAEALNIMLAGAGAQPATYE